ELHTDDQSDLRSKQPADVSGSAEVREKVEENIAVESTEIMKADDEQRSEGISLETNPVRNDNTEDGLTSRTHTEKQKTEEEILDRNQTQMKENEESVTPETFPTSIIFQEDTKEDFVPDTVEYGDADTEFVVGMRENGLNLVPNSKTETNGKSRIVKTMLTDGTENWEIVKPVKNQEAEYDDTDVKYKKSDRIQEILEEEQESRLVAGITSAKPWLTTTRTPSVRPKKSNKNGKNRTIKKSKQKKRKKDNNTPKKKEIQPTTPSPYFMNNYCPPECACYGRVVQCSDKGVNTVPYGIPYNARYILLMNNHINGIQLDLFNNYTSMEFLVLSNNQLTDGAIEGAFEGVPALKRLYLDKNLLKSVPNNLPVSLEELRLDNNRVRVMSEAAWARCPSLLVLSLSYNSLGNGSDPLPNAVLSPLCNLRTLNLDHNQLTSVPLGLPLSIKELYLKGNLIEQFRGGAFNGKSGLLVLDLSANRLTNTGLLRDSLLNATHLESLNLEGNRLKQVPRHLPPSLKTLNLQGNLISSIKKATFSSLKNLEHLGLARNKIFKVATCAFRTLLVLHQLDMSHNTLRQVPRQLPQGLHSVTLTHNKIQSVPRDAFCWGNKSLSGLVQVQLEHNLIDLGKLDAQAFTCLRGFQVVHFY
uniref:Wu:fc23c09 n=1 Tax=Acanthochromis polyacanthus TaxID=80966 RepID=A0A3Q1FGH0_9TELE